jgi:hypothetical protein
MANANVVPQYHATQELEATRMLKDLIREPQRYEHWFERYSAAVVFRKHLSKGSIDANRKLTPSPPLQAWLSANA